LTSSVGSYERKSNSNSKGKQNLEALPAFDEDSGLVNVIIETPKGSRNKYKYNGDLNLYELGGVMPAGASFPYDFGFVPQTLGEDGDPVDMLVLMDEPVFVGCLVRCRVIGVIEAEQTEDGKTERNDRLIAVYEKCVLYQEAKTVRDLNKALLDEIQHFFVSYNEMHGKTFKPLGCSGRKRATELIEEGRAKYKEKQKSKSNGKAKHAAH